MPAPEPPSGFEVPDWNAPVDVDAQLEQTPSDVVVKGMYFEGLLREAAKRDVEAAPGHPKYRAFKDYPLRELMKLELDLVPKFFPEASLREGLRRLGWLAYPILIDSMIGKIIFGVLGDDIAKVFKVSAKGYAVSINRGRAVVLDSGPDFARIHLTEMYNFPDCYQLGVFEGALRYYGREGEIVVRTMSDIEVELFVRWQ